MGLAALINDSSVITSLIAVDNSYCPTGYVRVANAAEEGMTAAQATTAQQAADVRSERNAFLIESDSMALADRVTDAWRTYRQALRDVPTQAGFPNSITWPTKPN